MCNHENHLRRVECKRETQRGEDGDAPMEDLEVPPIVDDDEGREYAINEEEDEDSLEDDYLDLTLNDLLGLAYSVFIK